MPTPTADTYVAASGETVYAGRTSPAARATPLLSAGTVTMLLKDWSGTGFQLLSSDATNSVTYAYNGHAGADWDDEAQMLWEFGAETHGTGGMDNSVYRWDASDGKFKKMYLASPCPGEYRVGADGVLYADAAHTKPWGMHTFRRVIFDPVTKKLAVLYDPNEHAYVTATVQEGAITQNASVCAIWYYDTVAGTWSTKTSPDTTAFMRRAPYTSIVYVPGRGWIQLSGNKAWRLDDAGVGYETASNAIGAYQDYTHVIGNNVIRMHGNSLTQLYSRHPLDTLVGGTIYNIADFPAMADLHVQNAASCALPDGRIVLFASSKLAPLMVPVVIDPVANTVALTGHTLPTSSASQTLYEFRIGFSARHNCIIYKTIRQGPTTPINRIYGYRI